MTAPEPMRALWVSGPRHGTVAELPPDQWNVAVAEPTPAGLREQTVWGVHLLRVGGRHFRVLLPPASYARDGLPRPEWTERALLALIDATRMQVQAVERSE